MVYISGPNDTLQGLKEKEGYAGDLSSYAQECLNRNPEMCRRYPGFKQKLPAYTPVFLPSEDPVDLETRQDIWNELSKFSQEERKMLYELQQQGADIPTQVATTSFMEKFQEYAEMVRQWLKVPLITTPWDFFNKSLTNKSTFKGVGESSNYISTLVKKSSSDLDKLYEAMLERDNLNQQLYLLKDQKGSEVSVLRRNLDAKIKEVTKTIKQLLPKKIDAAMNQYLRRKFTPDAVRKMRANCYSAKATRGGSLLTTKLQVLNKSGLSRLRTMVNGLKTVGQQINFCAKLLNWAVVGYDTLKAYKTGGNVARTFITGALSVYLSGQAVAAMGGTAALGGFVLGSGITASNLILGSTVLVCVPGVGWIALAVGLVAAGAVSYASKNALEGVWDLGEPVAKEIYNGVSNAVHDIYKQLQAAWAQSSEWVLDFYGTKD